MVVCSLNRLIFWCLWTVFITDTKELYLIKDRVSAFWLYSPNVYRIQILLLLHMGEYLCIKPVPLPWHAVAYYSKNVAQINLDWYSRHTLMFSMLCLKSPKCRSSLSQDLVWKFLKHFSTLTAKEMHLCMYIFVYVMRDCTGNSSWVKT